MYIDFLKIILFIFIGFLFFSVNKEGGVRQEKRSPTHLIFVVDNSLSMGIEDMGGGLSFCLCKGGGTYACACLSSS